MKYLILSADYIDYSLKDDLGNSVDRMLMPRIIQDELEAWNVEYQLIIPLSIEERASRETRDKIRDLDSRGISLAAIIADSMADHPKVAYYSEGLMRRV
jgi:hypothetical protein